MAHEASPLATCLTRSPRGERVRAETRGVSGEASESHVAPFAMSEWPAGLANGEVSGSPDSLVLARLASPHSCGVMYKQISQGAARAVCN